MLDCGIHPSFKGPASLPFFDATDLDQVDVMLVTHFHLDHVAAMPFVGTKTNFKVRMLKTLSPHGYRCSARLDSSDVRVILELS